ncbi:glycosyltransferase [Solwaraspora sp. WMMA2056]|uniref:glycosyltransferase family 4 protein n=1 Tax=Solwaraspora sp. WMMA2056 TaxID=3015161 RepID=UPI00259B0D20|nr:glycosyltransferase [Solwaraspora sp. WMMA2056]WJK42742.1 glycosyltransferase [Solwaraspora sp. WMMA2056]
MVEHIPHRAFQTAREIMEKQMHVMISAVGARTEHWIELFAALGSRSDTTVTLVAADVSDVTRTELGRLSERYPRFHHHIVPHALSEQHTGHMASVLFRTGVSRYPRYRPDVLHVIGEAAYLSTWQVIRACRRRWPSIPVSLYAAQNIVIKFPVPFPFIERQTYRRIDHAFPITPAALYVLRAKGYAGAASLVPLGVDTDLFTPRRTQRADGRFTVGFVGRLEHHKGVSDLLRATESTDCDAVFIGTGTLAELVEQAARRRPGRVTLHSWAHHDDLPDHLGRMDVLALPSIEVVQRNVLPWVGIPLREQFGRVLVEAMACGIPVVGSDVGEIPYVVGDAGLTYPAGDWTALADRLARLRDDPRLRATLSANGLRQATERFSWGRVANAMCEVWHELAAVGGRPPAVVSPGAGPALRPQPTRKNVSSQLEAKQ